MNPIRMGIIGGSGEAVLAQAVRILGERWPESPAHTALGAALVTPPAAMATAVRERLAALIGRFL